MTAGTSLAILKYREKCNGREMVLAETFRAHPPAAQGLGRNSAHLSVFSGTGKRVSFAEVLSAAENAEVVLVGETHDDPVAHQIELYLLVSLLTRRCCSLSLEMFETDVQTILDEYLTGKIQERDFLKDARPWANYQSDYRFLIECAKDAQAPVVAANVPRRYVSAVSHQGPCVLSQAWPKSSMTWLPPVPLPKPSHQYLEHISQSPAVPIQVAELGMSDGSGLDGCPYMRRPQELSAQIMLWDSGMAYSIAKHLNSSPGRTVVHVCGVFHVERFTGIGEMLSHYRPGTKQVVVAIYPELNCHKFVPAQHADAADFIILTDASLPRSFNFYS